MTWVARARRPQVLLPALADLPGHLVWRAHARVAAALERGAAARTSTSTRTPRCWRSATASPARSRAWPQTISVSRTTDDAGRRRPRRARAGRAGAQPRRPAFLPLTRTARGRCRGAHAGAATSRTLEDDDHAGLHPRRARGPACACCSRWSRPDLAPDTPEALRESIGFLITRLHLRMHARLQRRARAARHRAAALRRPGRPGGDRPDLPVGAGPHLRRQRRHMVQLVDELEERGLLERRRLPTDRRAQVLHLRPGAAGEAGGRAAPRGRGRRGASRPPDAPAEAPSADPAPHPHRLLIAESSYDDSA